MVFIAWYSLMVMMDGDDPITNGDNDNNQWQEWWYGPVKMVQTS